MNCNNKFSDRYLCEDDYAENQICRKSTLHGTKKITGKYIYLMKERVISSLTMEE